MNKTRGIMVPLSYTTIFVTKTGFWQGKNTQNPVWQSKKTGRKPMGPADHWEWFW